MHTIEYVRLTSHIERLRKGFAAQGSLASAMVSNELDGLLVHLRDNYIVADPPFDTVWPGEETVERLWREQKGVSEATGKMWLTPRMERLAGHITASWALENASSGTNSAAAPCLAALTDPH